MLTFIGIIFILLSIAMFVTVKAMTLRKEDAEPDYYGKVAEKHPDLLLNWNLKKSAIGFGVGVLFIIFSSALLYARPGHQYYIVYPTGQVSCVYNQGWKVIMPFSRVQEWESYSDIKVIIGKEPRDGIEGVIEGGIDIRFIDKVLAKVKISVRMQLPQDDKSFEQIVKEFRHPKNLINNTLIPTVREQVVNTGYMFTAEDYVSGDASNFRATLDEQLKDGGYAVDKEEINDTIMSDIKSDSARKIKEVRTTYKVMKRLDKNNKPIRIDHDIKKNNIVVSQVIVDQVILEKKFQQKLEASRDISAQKSIERQKIETAKVAQQRIVAEGERDKAAEKVKQELAQVNVLISIETDREKERTVKELAIIQLETAKINAKALMVKKDAEAYANRKMVSAGLTPMQRAEWEYKTSVGVAAAIAGPTGLKLPTTMMSGGSGGDANMLESILSTKLLTGK